MTGGAANPTKRVAQDATSRTRREWLALAVIGVGTCFALAGVFGPWFVLVTNGVAAAPYTDVRDYGVGGWSATDTTSGITATPSGNYLSSPELGAAFLVVSVLAWLAVVAGLAAFSLAYVAPWWPRAGRFPALAGLAAAALSLATPIIFLGAFLAAAKTEGLLATGAGLWGSEASSQSRVTWSAGGAWYSLVIAAALLAFGSVLLVRRRVASPLPTAP